MNDAILKELKIVVEQAVWPVRATMARKRRMREELLAHLSAIYEEESAKLSNDQTALDQAKQRFGDIAALVNELQDAVPLWNRLAWLSEIFLIWLGCTCVLFFFRQEAIEIGASSGMPYSIEVVYALVGGSILFWWVSCLCRKIAFPVHPGDFLLALGAVGYVANSVELALIAVRPSGVIPFAAVTLLAMLCVCLWAVWRVTGIIWKGWFVLCGLQAVHWFLWAYIHYGQNSWFLPDLLFWTVSMSILLIAAFTVDLAQKRKFPWSHWLGVMLSLSSINYPDLFRLSFFFILIILLCLTTAAWVLLRNRRLAVHTA
jgi:hypothetical protein